MTQNVVLTDELRDLVEEHMEEVHKIANALRGSTHRAARDDLESAGYLGLCEAASVFDPNRGAFEYLAPSWIRGEMKELRRGEAIKASRQYTVDHRIMSETEVAPTLTKTFEEVSPEDYYTILQDLCNKCLNEEETELIMQHYTPDKVPEKDKVLHARAIELLSRYALNNFDHLMDLEVEICADVIEHHRPKYPTLLKEDVMRAIELHKQNSEDQRYPSQHSGIVQWGVLAGMSWDTVDKAIREGRVYGLKKGSSLGTIKKELGLSNVISIPQEDVLECLLAHQEATGELFAVSTPEIAAGIFAGKSGSTVDGMFRRGCIEGWPKKSSLAKFKAANMDKLVQEAAAPSPS